MSIMILIIAGGILVSLLVLVPVIVLIVIFTNKK